MSSFPHSLTRPPLGPDPEPYGERFAKLLATRASDTRGRVLSAPAVCPLERAFGRHTPCSGGDCAFYRVPDVAAECAVEQWAPSVSRHPRLAEWFLERRRTSRDGRH